MAAAPSQSERPLAGRVALVTGAASAIGQAIALALAEAGADVGFTFRTSEAGALKLEQALVAAGVRAAGVRADLRHSPAVEAALQAMLAHFGRLDIVVNNLGRYETAAFTDITDAQWEQMLATNLTAPFLVSRAAVEPLRRAGGGRIIQLASVGAFRAFPSHAHYCASKAGLAHLTRAMARALAPAIQVNAVAPGLIHAGGPLNDWERKMRDRTPLARAGTPADVAAAVRFLATCNPFLTGQTLVVDGGLSLT
ncbi:MAG: SDR family NAD(P)-dependent oxidoreductase [Terriglobales bacterium]